MGRRNPAPAIVTRILALAVLVLLGAARADTRMRDRVRSSIVEALGLATIPDPAKANVSQSEYERAHKEYLTRLRRSVDDNYDARPDFFTMVANENKITRDGTVISFSINPTVFANGATIESANLRLLLDHDEESDAGELEVRVYEYREAFARRSSSSGIGHLVGQRVVHEARALKRRWLEFDLTEELQEGTIHDARLLVQVVKKDYLKEDVRPARGVRVAHPSLNLHTVQPSDTADQPARSRRSVAGRAAKLMTLHRSHRVECRGEGKRCCRHRMRVQFKDLEGFEFISQPRHFDAGYCKGRCPPKFNPAHHHALLQGLVWKEDHKKAPRPCCAPSKLAHLQMVFLDEHDPSKLNIATWEDMRVLECACS